jgi:probable phosphoglycerate mutase
VHEPQTIFLARHGQTEWNVEGRLQGGKDSPLTNQGRLQAEAIGQSLKSAEPGLILSSPLGRASKTAAIIAKKLGIPVEKAAGLGELRFGEAEGLSLKGIEARWPGFLERREQDKWRTRWPEGESYEDANIRVTSLVEETLPRILSETAPASLLIVGHETINMVLMGRLLGVEPSVVIRLGQPNNVIYRLRGRLIDHAYLDDTLDWTPGLLQKRSDDIVHIAA